MVASPVAVPGADRAAPGLAVAHAVSSSTVGAVGVLPVASMVVREPAMVSAAPLARVV